MEMKKCSKTKICYPFGLWYFSLLMTKGVVNGNILNYKNYPHHVKKETTFLILHNIPRMHHK